MALFGETSCCLLNQSAEELFDYSLPLLLLIGISCSAFPFYFRFSCGPTTGGSRLIFDALWDLVVDSDGHHYNNKMVISFVFAFSRLYPSGTNQKFGFVGGKEKEEDFVSRHSS